MHVSNSLVPASIWPRRGLQFIEETAVKQRKATINLQHRKPIIYSRTGPPISGKALRDVVFTVALHRTPYLSIRWITYHEESLICMARLNQWTSSWVFHSLTPQYLMRLRPLNRSDLLWLFRQFLRKPMSLPLALIPQSSGTVWRVTPCVNRVSVFTVSGFLWLGGLLRIIQPIHLKFGRLSKYTMNFGLDPYSIKGHLRNNNIVIYGLYWSKYDLKTVDIGLNLPIIVSMTFVIFILFMVVHPLCSTVKLTLCTWY